MIRAMSIVNGVVVVILLIGAAIGAVRSLDNTLRLAALAASALLVAAPFILARHGLSSFGTATSIKIGWIANWVLAVLVVLFFVYATLTPGRSIPLAILLILVVCGLNIVALGKRNGREQFRS